MSEARPVPNYLRPTASSTRREAGSIISSTGNGSPHISKTFEPNPTPAYLRKDGILPDVRLNAKTVSAMEQRKHQREAVGLAEIVRGKSSAFHPTKWNPAILRGPTFVPSKSTVPLTQPIEVLPDAEERSMRTRAYKAWQHERVEVQRQIKELIKVEKEKEQLEELRRQYQKNKFRARPVPESTYKPHIKPRVALGSFARDRKCDAA